MIWSLARRTKIGVDDGSDRFKKTGRREANKMLHFDLASLKGIKPNHGTAER